MNKARIAAAVLDRPVGRVKVPWRGVVPPENRDPVGTEPLLEWSLGAGHVAGIIAVVLAAARLLAYFN